MKTFAQSLSLGSGAFLIGLLSVIIVWLLCTVLPRVPHSLWVVGVPLILAYSLYWLPVWVGSDPSEYGAWAVLGIGTWFLPGVIVSAVTVLILRKRRAK